MRPFTILTIVLLGLGFSLYTLQEAIYETAIYIVFLAIFIYQTRKLKKINNFLTVFLLFMFLELLATSLLNQFVFGQYSGFVQNNWYFSIALLLDVSIFIYCKKSASYLKSAEEQLYDMANSLTYIFVAFCAVDLLALVENVLRNLEHLGIPEDLAKNLWELQFMFDHYAKFKVFLLTVSAIILFASVSSYRIEVKRQKINEAL